MATKEKGKTHLYVLTMNFDCTYTFARKRDAMECYEAMLRHKKDEFEKQTGRFLNESGQIKSSMKDESPPYALKDKHWQTVHDTDNDFIKNLWFDFNRCCCIKLEKIYLMNLNRKQLVMNILANGDGDHALSVGRTKKGKSQDHLFVSFGEMDTKPFRVIIAKSGEDTLSSCRDTTLIAVSGH